MRSLFRPDDVPDESILDDHRPLLRSLERRGVICGGLSVGALVMLTGCDVKRPEFSRGRSAGDIAVQRQGAGLAVQSEQACADLSGVDDFAAAQVQRLL